MENLTTKELTQLEKKVVHVFGKDHYLLGINSEGEKVYLTAPSWDCDWYWGFGYITTFTNNKNPEMSMDISSHSHWDSSIIGKHEYYNHEKGCFVSDNNYIHHSNEYFGRENSVLTDKESWTLAELMKTAYTLKESAELFGRGGSCVSSNPNQDILKDEALTKRINEVLLPEVFKSIKELLTPKAGA